jgi:YidC/Oxa1 family membrane protein insertase
MENNKNVIIAVLLMLAVWFYFNQNQKPADVPDNQTVATTVQPDVIAPAVVTTAVPSMTPSVVTSAPEIKVEIKTPLYTADFNSIGGRLDSMQLLNYGATAADNTVPVHVVEASTPRLATLGLQGKSGIDLNSETNYALLQKPIKSELTGTDSTEIVFRSTGTGIIIDRVYTLRADSYLIGVETRVMNTGTAALSGELEISLLQPWDASIKNDMVVFTGVSSLVDGKLEQVSVDDLKEESPTYGAGTTWTSFETKYFISAIIPTSGAADKVRIVRDGDIIRNYVVTPFFTIAPGTQQSYSYDAFFGPRDESILEAVGHQMTEAISYGIFTPIAVPLLKTLRFFYGYLGNYGLAIILLTVIIKLIFWPLTHKSYASMKSMQKLQPEMAKLKEKYKNDRQRQGQEMMEMYKKHRVNPMGGCLPMVIQIPVFFALYRVLYQAIELRHAPFMFWITDLADKDPYYITPIIMGATMFIQQKLTPSTADPMQQKIFLLMPVIFTALFLNFPAGLVIYWLVNNLLTITQQVYIHRTMS